MLCPKCRNETHSKNKGIIRHRTCRNCGYEFTTIEVIREEPMTIKDKLEKFMRDRKRGENAATLAAYFMVTSTTIARNMKELENEGKVIKTQAARNSNVWHWNHRLAVPDKPAQTQQPQPFQIVGKTFKATTSYPNVRGYED